LRGLGLIDQDKWSLWERRCEASQNVGLPADDYPCWTGKQAHSRVWTQTRIARWRFKSARPAKITLGGFPDLGSGRHRQMVRWRYAAMAALCSARTIFRSVPHVLYMPHAQKRVAISRNVWSLGITSRPVHHDRALWILCRPPLYQPRNGRGRNLPCCNFHDSVFGAIFGEPVGPRGWLGFSIGFSASLLFCAPAQVLFRPRYFCWLSAQSLWWGYSWSSARAWSF